MQTFLPDPSYAVSASCLDMRRLGKQRLEVVQILNALRGRSKGWRYHTATRMWRGYEQSLVQYGRAICGEWTCRGYEDNQLKIIESFWLPDAPVITPLWLGDFPFHRAQQSNLVKKKPEHYRRYFPDVPDNLPYIWPKGLIDD